MRRSLLKNNTVVAQHTVVVVVSVVEVFESSMMQEH